MCTRVSLIAVLLFHFATDPLSLWAQKVKGFTITGHLDGVKDGYVVKLGNRFADWHKVIWTDSCVIANGNFHLTGDEVHEGPRDYEIAFYKGINGKSLPEAINSAYYDSKLHFFIENGDKIVVSGNSSQWKDINISGSRSNKARVWADSLVRYADSLRSQITRRLRKISDSIGYDRKLVEEQILLMERLDKYLDSATKNISRDHQVGIPYLIVTLHDFFSGYHGYFQKELYEKLSPEVKNSYLGKEAKSFALLSLGQPFPDFSLSTTEGTKINLKDFVGKNKITLVHFWGTSSVAVDYYQRELKVRHKKYKDKGLEIIAVSADTDLQAWKEQIEIAGYPWKNVIAEPRGWEKGSLINDLYGEGGHAIPNTTNVLLDNKGKILAWDVYGPELQYYLEKYLN